MKVTLMSLLAQTTALFVVMEDSCPPIRDQGRAQQRQWCSGAYN